MINKERNRNDNIHRNNGFPRFLVNTSSRWHTVYKRTINRSYYRCVTVTASYCPSKDVWQRLYWTFHIHVRQRLQWHEIIRRVEVCKGEQWSDGSTARARARARAQRSLDTCMSILNVIIRSQCDGRKVFYNICMYVHNIIHLNVWEQMWYVSFMGISMGFLFLLCFIGLICLLNCELLF